jgi:hypothetical protein
VTVVLDNKLILVSTYDFLQHAPAVHALFDVQYVLAQGAWSELCKKGILATNAG